MGSVGGEEEKKGSGVQLPIVDFRGLERSEKREEEGGSFAAQWEACKWHVVKALESYGCFEAIFDPPGMGRIRGDLFNRAMPELLALPPETKMRINSSECETPDPDVPYISSLPGMAYQSLRVVGASTIEGCQHFTSLMWPQPPHNPSFCNTVRSYTKHMHELAQMVQKMVLESFGMGLENKYSNFHNDPKIFGVRLAEYGVPSDQETLAGMRPHKDPNMMTIVCQHQEGLEVQTSDGEWIHVVPLPNSFTFMIGESFSVWTNGRFRVALHRVEMDGTEKRYSALSGTYPDEHRMVQPIEELVDSEHPLLYKPFKFKEYMNFRFSGEGRKYENPLEAFCGIKGESLRLRETSD